MKTKAQNRLRLMLTVVVLLSVCPYQLAAEKVVHSFNIAPQGANPESALITDSAGNLYGTTFNGGGFGTVFELKPSAKGGWTEKVLYNFRGNSTAGPDGAFPQSSLIFDSAGNLYGTTSQGGIYGAGTVFKLTPGSKGDWSETIIHTFVGYPYDGASPVANLTMDGAGNLYGTTEYGGNADICGDQYNTISCGMVFELSPVGDHWNETVLHNFQGGNDGCGPEGGLIFDQSGNLYGTTVSDGGNGYACDGPGTAFMLSPAQDGSWTENIIYGFSGVADFGNPSSSLIFDPAGNLYGTEYEEAFELSPGTGGSWTESMVTQLNYSSAALVLDSAGNLYGTTMRGGNSSACSQGCGSVFELSPGTNGWSLSTLYSFTGGTDGASPLAAVLFDLAGNLLTTTSGGGSVACYNSYPGGASGCGAIVKLTSTAGVWTLSASYDFPTPTDGGTPMSNLIADADGNFYGTAEFGGTGQCLFYYFDGCGAVFELSPSSDGKWTEKILYSFQSTNDGAIPAGPVTFDQSGNLYGMTMHGGSEGCPAGCGTVYELSPMPDGTWKEQVIYTFSPYAYGIDGPLVIDKQGALYGVIPGPTGEVFQLVPTVNGGWQFNILHEFGSQPTGVLIADKAGNLYGTTSSPGSVYELSHDTALWSLHTLYNFNENNGSDPESITLDSDGNIYGVTQSGGLYEAGVAYKLTRESGTWNQSVLYNFAGVNGDGGAPIGNLTLDSSGNLYGTTTLGGINGGGCGGLGCGTAFELSPSANGQWNERILHRFTGGMDGGQPESGFIFGPDGNLYATTSSGGFADQGTVFAIEP